MNLRFIKMKKWRKDQKKKFVALVKENDEKPGDIIKDYDC